MYLLLLVIVKKRQITDGVKITLTETQKQDYL